MKRDLLIRSVASLTFVGVLAIATPRQAAAAPILDQSCCGGSTNLTATFTTLTRAQTFTVGMTGVLTSADVLLSLNGGGTVQFDILGGFADGASLAGIGAPLASYNFSWAVGTASPTYFNLDFADLAVSAGDFLAIVMRHSVNGGWIGSTGNPYAGGEALTTTFPAPGTFTNNLFGSSDFGFRTYVEIAAVPEPATLTLLGCAIGTTLMRRSRRRSTSSV